MLTVKQQQLYALNDILTILKNELRGYTVHVSHTTTSDYTYVDSLNVVVVGRNATVIAGTILSPDVDLKTLSVSGGRSRVEELTRAFKEWLFTDIIYSNNHWEDN